MYYLQGMASFLRRLFSTISSSNTYVYANLQSLQESTLEYALFGKSEKIQCGSPWPFGYVHKKLLDVISFNVALNSGPCRPFEISVLTLPIV